MKNDDKQRMKLVALATEINDYPFDSRTQKQTQELRKRIDRDLVYGEIVALYMMVCPCHLSVKGMNYYWQSLPNWPRKRLLDAIVSE